MSGEFPTPEEQDNMAKALEADSLRYLPLDAVARCIGLPESQLCRACITGQYPTPTGQQHYELDRLHLANVAAGANGRSVELPVLARR
jgi:amidophosphoribosyltransferase